MKSDPLFGYQENGEKKKMKKENHILFTMLSLSLSLLPKIQKIKNQIIKKFKPKCIMSYR